MLASPIHGFTSAQPGAGVPSPGTSLRRAAEVRCSGARRWSFSELSLNRAAEIGPALGLERNASGLAPAPLGLGSGDDVEPRRMVPWESPLSLLLLLFPQY